MKKFWDASPRGFATPKSSVGVALEDKKKLEVWYDASKKKIDLDRMSAMFLVGVVLARIDEVYGADGAERVDAAINHFIDYNDFLSVFETLKYPTMNLVATNIAHRVQLAIMNETLREKQEEEAMKIVEDENRRRADDEQIVSGQVQGGGKCTFEIGRTKASLKEEGGGGTSIRRQESLQMIEEAKRTLDMAQARKCFPASLWV